MKTVLATLACIALLHCHDSIQSPDLSDPRMTDGTVLDVTPGGDVRIGAKASLIITANDGMVYVRGPFAVGNDLIVRDGIVTIKHLEQADAGAARRIKELESRIAELEGRLAALEKPAVANR